MNAIFTDEQLKMLETPLTPDEIEVKQGARYITSFAAIRKANKIFGAGNWGYHITSPFEVTDTGQTNKNGNAIYRVQVQITLEVRGCMPVTDLGDCDSQGTSAAAMSMATKGAVSDGVKRCLRIFGPAFGLDLYDKDWRPEQEQTSAPPQNRDSTARQTFNTPAKSQTQQQQASAPGKATTKQISAIWATAKNAGLDTDGIKARCKQLFGIDSPRDLTIKQASEFIDALKQPA